MTIQSQRQNVSVAHRPNALHQGVGGNLRVELAVATDNSEPFMFAPYRERIKARLDHRCLFEDEPIFFAKPSTLEAVTHFVARDIFQIPPSGAQWSSLTIWELDRYSCTVTPESMELRLTIQHRNLTLTVEGRMDPTTHEAVSRSKAIAHVDQVFKDFNGTVRERLFTALKAGIPGLSEAVVDLGSHRSVRLADDPSSLR